MIETLVLVGVGTFLMGALAASAYIVTDLRKVKPTAPKQWRVVVERATSRSRAT